MNEILVKCAGLMCMSEFDPAVARKQAAIAVAMDDAGEYDKLDAGEKAQADVTVDKLASVPATVKAALAAHARLCKTFYAELVAAGFNVDQAALIVAHQGIGALVAG